MCHGAHLDELLLRGMQAQRVGARVLEQRVVLAPPAAARNALLRVRDLRDGRL